MLISTTLLIMCALVVAESFEYQKALLRNEEREIAKGNAKSCISLVLADVLRDREGYLGLVFSSPKIPCTIREIDKHVDSITIISESISNTVQVVITAEIHLDSTGISIVSWEET